MEDPESRVFHKALCVATAAGPRLLTIGATDALLKLWRVEQGRFVGETLWHPRFGGKWDRLRDVELGDLNADGKPELVVGTHDQGVIAVVSRAGEGWQAREIYREAETFVHEIELGDVLGTGGLPTAFRGLQASLQAAGWSVQDRCGRA